VPNLRCGATNELHTVGRRLWLERLVRNLANWGDRSSDGRPGEYADIRT
jgi:hypothetical protein